MTVDDSGSESPTRRRRSGASNLRQLWSAELITLTLSAVQGLVIARALGPGGYGTYAVVTTFTAFVFLLLDPRSGEVVVRFLAQARVDDDLPRGRAVMRAGLMLDVVWGVTGLLVVVLAGTAARRIFDLADGAALLSIVALGAALAAPVATSRAALTTLGGFRLVAAIQGTAAVGRAVAVSIVALGGYGLASIVWTITLSVGVEGLIFVIIAVNYARREMDGPIITASFKPLKGRLGEMSRFLVLADLSSLVGSVIKQVDVLVVAGFTSAQSAGYFRLAKSLIAPAGNIAGPVQTVLYPRLAHSLAATDMRQTRQVLQRTTRTLGLPLTVMALCALPFVGWFIRIVAGPEFAPATPITMVLLVGVAVSFATLHLRPLSLSLNEMRAFLWISTATSVVSVTAYLAAVQPWGALGVAWSRTIVVGLGALAAQFWIWSRLRRADGAHEAARDGEGLGEPAVVESRLT